MATRAILSRAGINVADSEIASDNNHCDIATNVVLDKTIMRSRPGYRNQTNQYPADTISIAGIWNNILGSSLLHACAGNLASFYAPSILLGNGDAALTDITPSGLSIDFISATIGNRSGIRAPVLLKNQYMMNLGASGPLRIESPLTAATNHAAGITRAFAIDTTGSVASPLTLFVNVGAGWMANNTWSAWRIVFGRKDADGNIMYGAPSPRVILKNNSGGAADVTIRVLMPKQVHSETVTLTAGVDFFQIYRANATAASYNSVTDEMQLVYESYVTAGQIAAGFADVVDIVPDGAIMGPYLYTNANTGTPDFGPINGIANANRPPPAANDIASWDNRLWFSDIRDPHSLQVTLLTAIVAGNTITVNGDVYTAIAAGPPLPQQFVISAGGTVTENLRYTAENLCEAINKYSSAVSAFQTENPQGLGASFYLERKTLSATAFTVSSNVAKWAPDINAAAVSSTAPQQTNAIRCSRSLQGDAVPVVNTLYVGRKDARIVRAIPLRDQLFVFTDAGVYRITSSGGDTPYQIQPFDLTFLLPYADAANVCRDRIYAASTHGVVEINDSGCQYVTQEIRPYFQTLEQLGVSASLGFSFCFGSESQGRVFFSLPVLSGTSGALTTLIQIGFVFDIETRQWTQWDWWTQDTPSTNSGFNTFPLWGVANQSQLRNYFSLYRSTGTPLVQTSRLQKEQGMFLASAYADDAIALTDLPITKTVRWTMQTVDPSMATHWRQVQLYYDANTQVWLNAAPPSTISVAFNTEIIKTPVSTTVANPSALASSMCLIPQSMHRGARLYVKVTHAVKGEWFGLEGAALIGEPYSNKAHRDG